MTSKGTCSKTDIVDRELTAVSTTRGHGFQGSVQMTQDLQKGAETVPTKSRAFICFVMPLIPPSIELKGL